MEANLQVFDSELKSRIVQLARDLILIKSTHSMPQERERCFQFLRNHLEAIPGIKLRMFESNGFESLVAAPANVEVADVMFLAHLDVVEHHGPEYYKSTLVDGRIYGPGAGDMKGALAILLVLMERLLREDPTLPIALAVTSDEECGGHDGARFLLEEAGLRARSLVLPDGGTLDEITVEEKGILHAKAHIKGRSAHASRPWRGDNALMKLMEGVARIQERFEPFEYDGHIERSDRDDSEFWFPTCTLTGVESDNESINRIPDWVEATFDIRFPPPHSAEEMRQLLKDALGPDAEVTVIVSAEPTHLEPDPVFLEVTESILGQPARLIRVAGGSDARFFRNYGIPVMLSRPLVGNIHGTDEWIDIQSMLDYYRICEAYVWAKTGVEGERVGP